MLDLVSFFYVAPAFISHGASAVAPDCTKNRLRDSLITGVETLPSPAGVGKRSARKNLRSGRP